MKPKATDNTGTVQCAVAVDSTVIRGNICS